MKKILNVLLIIIFIFSFSRIKALDININESPLLVSGKAVGLELNLGLKVMGTYAVKDEDDNLIKPWESSGIKTNDIIVKYNDKEVSLLKDLQKEMSKSNYEETNIEFIRNSKNIVKKIKPVLKFDGSYSLGLYIKDKVLGVGTLTYVLRDNNNFGSLGHNIKIDGDIQNGLLKDASVYDINKASNGVVGQKNATVSNEVIGKILKNTTTGVHGIFNNINTLDYKELYIGKKEDVKPGKASILTCIDNKKIEEFSIEILDAYKQNVKDIKSMKIRVTDERLLSKTGGIIQGMSGSPIIQNNKIIGAVTHVIVNNPKEGYGIYIEWMLNDMDIYIK